MKEDEDMSIEAITKLKEELKKAKKDKYGNIIGEAVVTALCSFCEQEPEFAQAIEQTDKTVEDCLKHISTKIKGNGISDLDCYRHAVQFYFPTADIHMSMTIDTCGKTDLREKNISVSHSEKIEKAEPKKSAITVSFDEIFGD